MKLTAKQKQILYYVNSQLDGIYDEEFDTFNCYILMALECIKDYPELEEDCKKYIKQLQEEANNEC